MQYAVVNGVRATAAPRGKGICPSCGGDMVAKCGTQIIHHWAHVSSQCDPWWENETQWHREWKEEFPEEYREVGHVAEEGEIHRADIKHPSGLVVEIQHSAMPEKERDARENFYGNMIWIVDAAPFLKNLHICHPLPRPDSVLAQDLRWHYADNGRDGANRGMFWRISENALGAEMVLTHSLSEIRDEIRENYIGHRQYYWKKPRQVWKTSTKPVFLDLGGGLTGRLGLYGPQDLPCLQYYPRKFLINALRAGVIPPN